MEDKDVEVKLASGIVTIRGKKRDEKEEKNKDYYLSEPSIGSFERSFQVSENMHRHGQDQRRLQETCADDHATEKCRNAKG